MQTPLSLSIGQTDIYIVDQIVKGRFQQHDRILDAGCGHGRNMHWFVHNHLEIFGTDADAIAIEAASANYPALPASQFVQAPCETLPFDDAYFNHVLCSAVLHFAKSENHFMQMMGELLRVLKPGGSLFIRMASVFGMEHLLTINPNGHSILPDGSQRYLLNNYLLETVLEKYNLALAETVKTTIVHGQRCMTTLVLKK